MAIEREFLGWDYPMLPRVAAWLIERFGLDMAGVLVVTPAGRAGRRLLELIVEAVERGDSEGKMSGGDGSGDKTCGSETPVGGGVLAPPTIITQGQLPSYLHDADAVASPLVVELALAKALRDGSAATVEAITSRPPAGDDLPGWMDLARQLAEVLSELGAEGLGPLDVSERPGFDQPRWAAIAEVDRAARDQLEARDLIDPHTARRRAIEAGSQAEGCRCDQHVVLVGTTDLPGVTRQMLALLDSPVTALIHAPDAEAQAFAEDATLVTEAWADRPLALDEARLVIADRPRDQARAVLDAIAQASADGELSPDQVSVGLGDEALGPTVARSLGLAGAEARLAGGKPLARSRPARLLAAVARYLRRSRFDDFAELVRHPDLADHLASHPEGAGNRTGVKAWLTLLDRYATDHLQGRVTGTWLGKEAPRLKAVYDAVHRLLPRPPGHSRPLSRWAGDLVAMLGAVYGHRSLGRFDPNDSPLVQALTQIAEVLTEIAELDETAPSTPAVTCADAIAIVLARLGGRAIRADTGKPAVELLGLLELPLDDAAVVVVTSLNEGAVPSSITADPLLPGSLRHDLGLTDNRRRLARDLYLLTAVTRARPDAVLITGQRDAEDSPLAPSRLLLRDDPDVVADRLTRFYAQRVAPPPPPLLTAGSEGVGQVRIPPPAAPAPPLNKLHVTAFRDYLACPYRFYLKHVRRLEARDDRAVEMDAGQFGAIAHEVLKAFGVSDLANATDAQAIERLLSDRLETEVRERFGREPIASVRLQRENLRQRLEAFARWQAASATEGWRIMPEHIEQGREAILEVDSEPFTITGRIDRIDEHPEHGYRVVDYKTADVANPPDKTHRKRVAGEMRWTNLQLPLYRKLAAAAGIGGTDLALGYILLPRDSAAMEFAEATWDGQAMEEAMDEAKRVVRAIREGVFWPPGDVPGWADDFTRVCLDRAADRAAIIAAGGGAS